MLRPTYLVTKQRSVLFLKSITIRFNTHYFNTGAVVTWTGNTSLEVRVDSFVESLDGGRKPINRTYLVYVAIDENDKPTKVPPFTPLTDEERMEYQAAEERRARRLGL